MQNKLLQQPSTSVRIELGVFRGYAISNSLGASFYMYQIFRMGCLEHWNNGQSKSDEYTTELQEMRNCIYTSRSALALHPAAVTSTVIAAILKI